MAPSEELNRFNSRPHFLKTNGFLLCILIDIATMSIIARLPVATPIGSMPVSWCVTWNEHDDMLGTAILEGFFSLGNDLLHATQQQPDAHDAHLAEQQVSQLS
jgi:hypothetical protein